LKPALAPDAKDALEGTVLGETYRIERRLAAGGMGTVYEASHARLPNKRYALKLLHSPIATNDEVQVRFRREAEIACRLAHPNIVEVLDFNKTPEGRPYLVMEYLEGHPFQDLLHEGVPAPGLLLAILEQVAEGLSAAHAEGVVHRDLKPENIFLVSRDDGFPLAKVVDFGISKLRDSQSLVTKDHAVMGTAAYMSPEQAVGTVDQIDHRTDIFALGAIAYQALTGTLPFEAPTVPGIIYRICHDEPDLTQLPNEATAAVISRALAKDKEARFSDPRELVAELAEALPEPGQEDTPSSATRESRVEGAGAACAKTQAAETEPAAASTPRATTDTDWEARPSRRRMPLLLFLGVGVALTAVAAVIGLAGTKEKGIWDPAPAPDAKPVERAPAAAAAVSRGADLGTPASARDATTSAFDASQRIARPVVKKPSPDRRRPARRHRRKRTRTATKVKPVETPTATKTTTPTTSRPPTKPEAPVKPEAPKKPAAPEKTTKPKKPGPRNLGEAVPKLQGEGTR
jgi:serine/threonine protein kinase